MLKFDPSSYYWVYVINFRQCVNVWFFHIGTWYSSFNVMSFEGHLEYAVYTLKCFKKCKFDNIVIPIFCYTVETHISTRKTRIKNILKCASVIAYPIVNLAVWPGINRTQPANYTT